MKILELNNIMFRYDRESDEFNLKNISLELTRGDFTAVLGPNGAGKSTLIKIFSGVLKPESGSISLKGKFLSSYSRKEIAKNISFVPQSSGNAYPFSVFEIVMMGRSPYLNLWGREAPKDIEIVKEALNLVGIYHLRDKGINEISGGEAQRAYIARAFAQQTEIILLDEPNSHLDIEHQLSIFRLLKKFNEEKGITIVTISHDLNLTGGFCKQGIILKNGELVHHGKVEDILTNENIKSIFNVDSNIIYEKDRLSVSIVAS